MTERELYDSINHSRKGALNRAFGLSCIAAFLIILSIISIFVHKIEIWWIVSGLLCCVGGIIIALVALIYLRIYSEDTRYLKELALAILDIIRDKRPQ